MRQLIYAGCLAATAVVIASSADAANVIKDGSFETPAVPVGGYTLFSTGQKIGPWTVVGASGNVAPVSKSFSQNGFTFPARAGKQWLDLTGNSNTATGVSQAVKTVAASQYVLTFYVGNVVNPGGVFGTTSTVLVYVNGNLVMTAVNSNGTGSTKQVWEKFTTTVTANSTSTTVTFLNGDPSNDTDCGLDAVSMVPVVAAADESLDPALFDDRAK